MGTTSGQGKTDGRGEGPLAAFAKRPMLKYAGFSLLLAWHYTLWFVPHSFALVPLLCAATGSSTAAACDRGRISQFAILAPYSVSP